MTPQRIAKIADLFTIDPGSVYDMTEEEVQYLLGEFGEREHIMDALIQLQADNMDDDHLLLARAEAIGCTVQDLLDFG